MWIRIAPPSSLRSTSPLQHEKEEQEHRKALIQRGDDFTRTHPAIDKMDPGLRSVTIIDTIPRLSHPISLGGTYASDPYLTDRVIQTIPAAAPKKGGKIIADHLTINSQTIDNTGGTITAKISGTINAQTIINNASAAGKKTPSLSGTIDGHNLTIHATTSLQNHGGTIDATGLLTIDAAKISNEARTNADGTTLGGILEGHHIDLKTQGKLITQKGSTIHAEDILLINAKEGIEHHAGATMTSGGDAQLITDGALINRGSIDSGGRIYVEAGSIHNLATTHEETTSTASTTSFTIQDSIKDTLHPGHTTPNNTSSTTTTVLDALGSITGAHGVTMITTGALINQGNIDAGDGKLGVQAATITNTPIVGTTTTISNVAQRRTTNGAMAPVGGVSQHTQDQTQTLLGGGSMTGKDITLVTTEGDLINSGNIAATDALKVQTAGKLINQQTLLTDTHQLTESQERFTHLSKPSLAFGNTPNDKELDLEHTSITSPAENTGSMTGKTILTDIKGGIINEGAIQATAQLDLHGSTVINQAHVETNTTESDLQMIYRGPRHQRMANDTVMAGSGVISGGTAHITGDISIENHGGLIVSEAGGTTLTSKGSITSDAIRLNGTNTRGYHPVTFHQTEMLSGGETLLNAGDSIHLSGTFIGSDDTIRLQAVNNITTDTQEATYISEQRSGGMLSGSTFHTTAVQSTTDLISSKGDVQVHAKLGDVHMTGTGVMAGASHRWHVGRY